jgi:arylsulfatase
VLKGSTRALCDEKDPVGGKMQNGKWMRQGDFKADSVAPPCGTGTWHLYEVADDPGETRDLAAEQPRKRGEIEVIK